MVTDYCNETHEIVDENKQTHESKLTYIENTVENNRHWL